MSGAEKVLVHEVTGMLVYIGRAVPEAFVAANRRFAGTLAKDARVFESAEAKQAAEAAALRAAQKAPKHVRVLKPSAVTVRDGYRFHTDGDGRVVRVTGKLKLKTGSAVNRELARKIREMGIAKDQAGHLIARIFKGPAERFNLLPQNGNFNMGRWRVMEKEWQKLLLEKPPHVIEVDIRAVYGDASGRPTSYDVRWTDNGVPDRRTYNNGPGGR